MDALTSPADEGASLSLALKAPKWLNIVDEVAICVLNVTLVAQVLLIFASTVVRSFSTSPILMGVAETAQPFLVTIAFLGGAVSYSRGHFIIITFLQDAANPTLRGYLRGIAEWVVIMVSIPLGYYSIPLLMANHEQSTVLWGIGYAWITVPITLGCALFVLHAGVRLLRLSWPAIAGSFLIVATAAALFFLFKEQIGAQSSLLYGLMFALFLVQLALGVPMGFILAVIGIVCVLAVGSGDMFAVVMNAQRGAGGFILLALPFFILAGFIIDRADIGGRIVDLVVALIGHVRGGLLQVMVIGCYLGSTISGAKAADMAMIGLPMTRRLKEQGYPPHESAAVLAASAAMAESVPPSVALILIGASTGISTGALFLAGVLPAAALALCLMVLIRIRASIFGWQPTARAPFREVFRSGKRAFLPLLLPVILIGGITGGFGTPTEISTIAVLYGILLGLLYGRFTLKTFWETLTDASMLTGMIFFTVSAATIFSWALTLEGVTVALANLAGSLGPGGFLVALIAITIIVAALLESFVTIIILAPLLLPVATQLNIDPLQYGIIMAESFGIGSVLPPIGIALYVACKIAGARVEATSRVVLGYLTVLIIGLLIVGAIPAITTFLPSVLNF